MWAIVGQWTFKNHRHSHRYRRDTVGLLSPVQLIRIDLRCAACRYVVKNYSRSALRDGKGDSEHAISTSAWVVPAGKVAYYLAGGGGVGRTSVQSMSLPTSCPMLASLIIAARKLSFIDCCRRCPATRKQCEGREKERNRIGGAFRGNPEAANLSQHPGAVQNS